MYIYGHVWMCICGRGESKVNIRHLPLISFNLIFLKIFVCIFIFILHVRVLGLRVCLCTTCMLGIWRSQQRVSDLWDWSSRRLWAAMWVLGIELCPLEEHPVFSTTEPFFQLPSTIFWDRVFHWTWNTPIYLDYLATTAQRCSHLLLSHGVTLRPGLFVCFLIWVLRSERRSSCLWHLHFWCVMMVHQF